VGILTNLQLQLQTARQHAELARLSGTLDGVRQHAHHVINIIEGEGGGNFDASFGNPGDGIGVLTHAEDRKHAGFAAATVPDDEVVNLHAELVDIAGTNANNFAVLARDRVVQFVLTNNDLADAQRNMANVLGVLSNALTGLDADSNGTKDLIAGEAGADAAYTQAQLMATYTLQEGGPPTPTPVPTATSVPTAVPTATAVPEATATPDTGPVTGDASVPALAQLALLLAGVLLIGGGFVFVASRKEEGLA